MDELNCKQFMSKTYCFCYFSAQSAQCALRNGLSLNLWFRKDSFRIYWLGGGGGCQSEQNYISLGSCLMVLSGQNTFILGNSPIVWQTCLLKREIPTSTFSSAKANDKARPTFCSPHSELQGLRERHCNGNRGCKAIWNRGDQRLIIFIFQPFHGGGGLEAGVWEGAGVGGKDLRPGEGEAEEVQVWNVWLQSDDGPGGEEALEQATSLEGEGNWRLNCTKCKWMQMKHKTELSINKLAKLGDAIAISKSETVTHSLTDWTTDRGRC